MKMEQTECSETSAHIIKTPGNHPKEGIEHSEQGENLKSLISVRTGAKILAGAPTCLGPSLPAYEGYRTAFLLRTCARHLWCLLHTQVCFIFNIFLLMHDILILPIYNLQTCISQPPAKTTQTSKICM